MQIQVISTIGFGKTTLSAFDNALKNANVYNYNIIPLSSIIPPDTNLIVSEKYNSKKEEFGWRLYVVKADIRSSQSNTVIGAGLGWYRFENGGGLFVEHEMEGLHSEADIKRELTIKIKMSLEDLCAFRNFQFDPTKVQNNISVAKVSNQPCCALSIAVYKAEPW